MATLNWTKDADGWLATGFRGSYRIKIDAAAGRSKSRWPLLVDGVQVGTIDSAAKLKARADAHEAELDPPAALPTVTEVEHRPDPITPPGVPAATGTTPATPVPTPEPAAESPIPDYVPPREYAATVPEPTPWAVTGPRMPLTPCAAANPPVAAPEPACNCGADRTGPSAEAHDPTCPAGAVPPAAAVAPGRAAFIVRPGDPASAEPGVWLASDRLAAAAGSQAGRIMSHNFENVETEPAWGVRGGRIEFVAVPEWGVFMVQPGDGAVVLDHLDAARELAASGFGPPPLPAGPAVPVRDRWVGKVAVRSVPGVTGWLTIDAALAADVVLPPLGEVFPGSLPVVRVYVENGGFVMATNGVDHFKNVNGRHDLQWMDEFEFEDERDGAGIPAPPLTVTDPAQPVAPG